MDILMVLFKAGILSALTAALYKLFFGKRYDKKYSPSGEVKTEIFEKPIIVFAMAMAAFAPLIFMAPGNAEIFKYIPVVLCLLIISTVDLKWNKIPNELVVSILAYWLIIVLGLFFKTGSFQHILKALGGGAMVFAIMYMVIMVSKGGFGSGDAKLIFAAAFCLGGSLSLYFFAIIFVLAAVVAAVLLLLKKADRRAKIPLAPFIMYSFIITLCLSDYFNALNLYWRLP